MCTSVGGINAWQRTTNFRIYDFSIKIIHFLPHHFGCSAISDFHTTTATASAHRYNGTIVFDEISFLLSILLIRRIYATKPLEESQTISYKIEDSFRNRPFRFFIKIHLYWEWWTIFFVNILKPLYVCLS